MGVTARDIREYYEAFSEFDKDRNGSINTSELGNVFRSLGENPTSMELEVRGRRGVQSMLDIESCCLQIQSISVNVTLCKLYKCPPIN